MRPRTVCCNEFLQTVIPCDLSVLREVELSFNAIVQVVDPPASFGSSSLLDTPHHGLSLVMSKTWEWGRSLLFTAVTLQTFSWKKSSFNPICPACGLNNVTTQVLPNIVGWPESRLLESRWPLG